MYGVDLYRRVRLACHREGLSRREASRQFGIDRKTVAKILLHSEPPGYRRRQPPKRPKLAPFLPFDEWAEIFGSERLTGALLDRLTHHVYILEMNGESYRLNQSQKRRKSPKPPA